MSWFRRVSDLDHHYSAGEIKLFTELQNRGLTIYMMTHQGITFDYKKDGVRGCEPDYLWGPPAYAVFLDGSEVHKSEHRHKIDGLVTKALERRDFIVDRFRYKAPMTNKRCTEIADAIGERVNKV